jgi:hemoglobin
MLKALMLAAALAATPPAEEPVAPYEVSNANAGATPFAGDAMLKAFHGRAGIERIVDRTIDLSIADPKLADIFAGHDLVRLRRTVKEQFCYILNGGCDYTGRDLATTHRDMGLQNRDFNRFVEHLQAAMDEEKVRFRDQNRFLAKLAPMQRVTVER